MAPIPTGGPPQITPAPAVLDQTILPLAQPIPVDDEPPSKKLRSEDNLVPESEFIAMHKVTANIEYKWTFNGNLHLVFRVPLQYKCKFRILLKNRNGS